MKHHREKHSHIVGGSDSTKQSDAVFSYSVLIITLGLIRAIHNRAIQTGNGENIILLYKYVHNLCVHYKIQLWDCQLFAPENPCFQITLLVKSLLAHIMNISVGNSSHDFLCSFQSSNHDPTLKADKQIYE